MQRDQNLGKNNKQCNKIILFDKWYNFNIYFFKGYI